ncbi:MAG: asparagine synthase C-terminal domain-containing protein [Betaproteobacteria bacterium]|nr:asparagine synthase C-terminal domain-containing protein [Betaproteobacteria bacterium]
MSGLCGWCGFGAGEAGNRRLIGAMSRTLTTFDHSPAQTLVCAEGAIGAAGLGDTASAYRGGHVTSALVGHPRWAAGAPFEGAVKAAQFAQAYEWRGPQVLGLIQGDFALALLREDRQELLLAVDRSSIRPLLYQSVGGALVFGSTAQAIAAHPAAQGEMEPQSLYDYVYFHMVPGPQTAFRGQVRLSPGQFVLFRRGQLQVQHYWQMRFVEHATGGVRQFKPPFRAALKQSVEALAGGEVTGAFLSGGTDSSTVCGLLGEAAGHPARTYSIGFDAPGYDETGYARIAASHFGTRHREYYVTPSDVVAAIPRIAQIYDQPFGNASAVPTYFCAKFAKEDGATRLLGGDGGDELFGGNARYATQYVFSLYGILPERLRQGLIEPVVHAMPGGGRLPLLRKLRRYIEQASVPMPERYETYNLLQRFGPENVFTREFLATVDTSRPLKLMNASYGAPGANSLINRMLALDFKFTLADNDLPKVTRMCELAGIDVGFPLLEPAVLDFALSLPPRLKLKGTRLRYFFKAALRDFLPREIIKKQKHGFGLPFGLWLNTHKPLQELAFDSLSALKGRRIVRASFIDELTDTHLGAHAGYYGTMVWVLMMLEQWARAHDQTVASLRTPQCGVGG